MFLRYRLVRLGLERIISRRFCNSKQDSIKHVEGQLSNINVLDMTRIIAGPYCTMMMGDLGANIIKVESLEGDEARKWGPPFMSPCDDSFYFLSVNRNKKSVCVDFKTDEGKSIIFDLARNCDVLLENFIPGKLSEFQLDYETLKKINPRLVYCSITGYGPRGPYAKKPGYDVIAAGMGGLLNVTGKPEGPPVKVGVPVTDLMTGLHAFGAISTALYRRTQTGLGQKIDCNLLSTQVAGMVQITVNFLNAGIEGQRWGTAHQSVVPYQAFPTSDGYIIIGAGSNKQFAALCKMIGRQELANDERFATNMLRVKNRPSLIEILKVAIKTKTTKEWSVIFQNAPFPNGPINNMEALFKDEHIQAIGLVKELVHKEVGPVKVIGPPTEYSDGGNFVRSAAPTLGEHTRHVLIDFLQYSEEKNPSTAAPTDSTVLTLRPLKSRRKVEWTQDTVDNELMNKKKSKCCCIYTKKKAFGESDSEESDDDECDHCFGHVEKRRDKRQEAKTEMETQVHEETLTVTLTTGNKDEERPIEKKEEPEDMKNGV